MDLTPAKGRRQGFAYPYDRPTACSIARRRNQVGRLSKGHLNVFAGLLFDARDGGTIR
jgi:hypothetical protein